MSLTLSFLNYLESYAAKDLGAIAAMFADDISLRDWKIRVVGKDAALRETQHNFDSVSSLSIEPLRLYEGANSVAGELRIVIDGQIELYVVDTLDFDTAGKITAIRAYLGRGDDIG